MFSVQFVLKYVSVFFLIDVRLHTLRCLDRFAECPNLRPVVIFCSFFFDVFLAHHSNAEPEDHPFLSVRDSLLNTLRI
jgi:hypothetical protein